MRQKSSLFIPSSFNVAENFEYLSFFYPESHDFLYTSRYTKTKELMKINATVVNSKYNYSLNEYYTTLHNGVTTCMQLNLRLMKPVLSFKQEHPLVNSTILKSRFKDIFCNNKHFIFKYPQYSKYRTIKVKSKPFKQEYRMIGSSYFSRSFNKLHFFNLLQEIKKISYRSNIFLRYRNYKKDCLSAYYLGFKFNFIIDIEARNNFYKNLKIRLELKPRPKAFINFEETIFFRIFKLTQRNLKYSKKRFLRCQFFRGLKRYANRPDSYKVRLTNSTLHFYYDVFKIRFSKLYNLGFWFKKIDRVNLFRKFQAKSNRKLLTKTIYDLKYPIRIRYRLYLKRLFRMYRKNLRVKILRRYKKSKKVKKIFYKIRKKKINKIPFIKFYKRNSVHFYRKRKNKFIL